jgi:membrane protein YdbS with pleckstrin-like domain
MKTQLHPGAKWLFRIRGFFGSIFILFILSWFLFPIIGLLGMFLFKSNIGAAILTVVIGFVLYIILVIVFTEVYARMAYNRWFYEFTNDNLKLERGIIWKKYSNIPYERVQNVDITRGVIARLCGFSSVNIQTAGYSFTGRGMPASEGYIPAVAEQDAEKIRDFLMKKIGKKQGL